MNDHLTIQSCENNLPNKIPKTTPSSTAVPATALLICNYICTVLPRQLSISACENTYNCDISNNISFWLLYNVFFYKGLLTS